MALVKIFISYAHEDVHLLNELKKHLEGLRRQGLIETWYDRTINAGQQKANEIEWHFNSAQIILLLISPDFMASDYINESELKRAMEHHNRGVADVIPVILRPTDWENAPFGKLQALPTDGRPVTDHPDQDQAFLIITKGIRGLVEQYTAEKQMQQIAARQKQIHDDLFNDGETFDTKAAMKNLSKQWQAAKPSMPTILKKLQNIHPDEQERNSKINKPNSNLLKDLFPDS